MVKWFFATLIIYAPITLALTLMILHYFKKIYQKPDGSDGASPEAKEYQKKFMRGFYAVAFFCFIFQWLVMYFTDGGRDFRF